MADEASPSSAANSLSFSEDPIRADDTEGVSLCRHITRHLGFHLVDSHVLLVGVGGARTVHDLGTRVD